jgi:hypothetical protein
VEGSEAMKQPGSLSDDGVAAVAGDLASFNNFFLGLSIVAVILGGIIATAH